MIAGAVPPVEELTSEPGEDEGKNGDEDSRKEVEEEGAHPGQT